MTLSADRNPAVDVSDHLLTCGPCNGFPELGKCTLVATGTVCTTCGKPCKSRGKCKRCALEEWRASR